MLTVSAFRNFSDHSRYIPYEMTFLKNFRIGTNVIIAVAWPLGDSPPAVAWDVLRQPSLQVACLECILDAHTHMSLLKLVVKIR